jgi:uncharacterized RDD family membrane protein YckC
MLSNRSVRHLNRTALMPARQPRVDDCVYYAAEDYAGLIKRTVILFIDLSVLMLAGTVFTGLGDFLSPGNEEPATWVLGLWLAVIFVYLVILEASSVGTVGFWMTGVRIVDYRGQTPSYIRMTVRLIAWAIGPFNLLFDFLWLSGDPHRQTLRDKFVCTYVIRKDAQPIGKGYHVAAYYDILGASVVFWEIRPSIDGRQAQLALAQKETGG